MAKVPMQQRSAKLVGLKDNIATWEVTSACGSTRIFKSVWKPKVKRKDKAVGKKLKGAM